MIRKRNFTCNPLCLTSLHHIPRMRTLNIFKKGLRSSASKSVCFRFFSFALTFVPTVNFILWIMHHYAHDHFFFKLSSILLSHALSKFSSSYQDFIPSSVSSFPLSCAGRAPTVVSDAYLYRGSRSTQYFVSSATDHTHVLQEKKLILRCDVHKLTIHDTIDGLEHSLHLLSTSCCSVWNHLLFFWVDGVFFVFLFNLLLRVHGCACRPQQFL
jgi:hypothetical protein